MFAIAVALTVLAGMLGTRLVALEPSPPGVAISFCVVVLALCGLGIRASFQ
jgi:hypothetical protein